MNNTDDKFYSNLMKNNKLSKERAKELFNEGYVVYVKTGEGEFDSTSNLFMLHKDVWDAQININKQGRKPQDVGFDTIIAFIEERISNYELEFYTLFSSKFITFP